MAKEVDKFKIFSDVDDFEGVEYEQYSDGEEDIEQNENEDAMNTNRTHNLDDGKWIEEKTDNPRERKLDLEKKLLEEENAAAKETVRQLKARLIRRTSLVNEIRSSYLRDVVTIKNILEELLTGTEKEAVILEYTSRLPSLDLREQLALRAPKNCELRVTPCETCGGKVEAVLADSDEVVNLKKVIDVMKKREERLRLRVAELDAMHEKITMEKSENALAHGEEKKVLYSEMAKLRKEIEKNALDAENSEKALKKMKAEVQTLKEQLAGAESSMKDLADARAEIRKYRNNIDDEGQAQRLLQEKVTQKTQEITALKMELRLLNNKFDLQSDELLESKACNGRQLRQIQKFEQETSSNDHEKSLLNKKITHLTESLQSSLQEIDKLLNVKKNLEVSVDKTSNDLQSTTQSLKSQLENAKADNRRLEIRLETALKDIDIKQYSLENAKKEIQSLTLALEQSQAALIAANSSASQRGSEHESKTSVHSESALSESLPGNKPRRRHSIPFGFNFGYQSEQLTALESATEPPAPLVLEPENIGAAKVYNLSKGARQPSRKTPVKHLSQPARLNGANASPIPSEAVSPGGNVSTQSSTGKSTVSETIDQPKDVKTDMNKGIPSPTKTDALKVNGGSESSNSISSSSATKDVVSAQSKSRPAAPAPTPAPIPAHAPAPTPAPTGAPVLAHNPMPAKEAAQPGFTEKVITVSKKQPNKAAFKVIELIPPDDDASPMELAIRASMLASLSTDPDILQNAKFKAVNAMIPMIKKYSIIVNSSLECLWRTIRTKFVSLDFLSIIFQLAEELNLLVKGETNISAVESLRSAAAAVFDSLSENKEVPIGEWREMLGMDEELLNALLKQNTDTSQMNFIDYFLAPKMTRGPKDLQDNRLLTTLESTLAAVQKIESYSDDSRSRLAVQLKEVWKDWSSAKKVFLDMDRLIEVEREKVRVDYGAKIKVLTDDLVKVRTNYERKCDKVDDLEGHVSDLLVKEKKLHEAELKLVVQEKQNEKVLEEMMNISATATELKGKLDAVQLKLKDSEGQVKNLKGTLKNSIAKCKHEEEAVKVLTNEITAVKAERDDWQAQYNNVLATEAARIAGMVSTGVQIYPTTTSVNLQTEFLTLPTDLHTIASSSLDKMGRVKYPLPLVHCSSPQKSSFDNHSIQSDVSSTASVSSIRTTTALVAALRSSTSFEPHDLDALNSNSNNLYMKPIAGVGSSSLDSLLSARSGISSVSSVSSLTNSTNAKSYLYSGSNYAHSLRRLNPHMSRNIAAPPSYDLKSFLGGSGPSLTPQRLPNGNQIILGGDENSSRSKIGSIAEGPDEKNASFNGNSVKYRPSTNGMSNIMPLTMEKKKKGDDNSTSGGESDLDVPYPVLSPLITSTSVADLQIGLPLVKRIGTGSGTGTGAGSASNHGASTNSAQTGRSVNLHSSRTNTNGRGGAPVYGDDVEDEEVSAVKAVKVKSKPAAPQVDYGGKWDTNAKDEKSVILSKLSLTKARNDFLSMV